MTSLRRLLDRFPRLALWLVAAALAVRLLVPAGYMLSPAHPLALVTCPGVAPAAHRAHGDSPAHHGAPDQPCAFAALAAPLAAVAAVALAAVAAVVAPAPAARPLRETPARAPPRW
ncbi:hypothetical protein KZ813_17455, partial [Sphingomonas sp. RHCKR7]|uniref:hypothetical protein n=1 Tax=Sphingomonas folli TaxID=2862497 RepID=UPI001CA548FD